MSGRFSSAPLLKGFVLSRQCHGLATKSLTDLLGMLIQTIAITYSRPDVPSFPTDLCRPYQQQCGVHPHKGQLIATIKVSWVSVCAPIAGIYACGSRATLIAPMANCILLPFPYMPHPMRPLPSWRSFSLL